MRLRKSLIALLLYLVPAMTVLVAYSAYHETLFKQPACRINCGSFNANPPQDIRKTLDLIDELARHKADLLKSAKGVSDVDLAFLQTRLNAFGQDYSLMTRYGDGNLHHRWARLNAQWNAKISEYLNEALLNDYFSDGLAGIFDNARATQVASLGRTNLSDSIFVNSSSLIGQAIANDILPPANNYFVSPSNLRGGGNGFNAGNGVNNGNSSFPSNPVSVVPLPSSVYFMLSALLLYGLFRRKPSLAPFLKY